MANQTELSKFLQALKKEIEQDGPLVLWTGEGEFPGIKCHLRGLSWDGRTIEEAFRALLHDQRLWSK